MIQCSIWLQVFHLTSWSWIKNYFWWPPKIQIFEQFLLGVNFYSESCKWSSKAWNPAIICETLLSSALLFLTTYVEPHHDTMSAPNVRQASESYVKLAPNQV